MAFREVLTGQERKEETAEKELREVFRTYLRKVRLVEVERIRRGMPPATLLRKLELDPFDAEEGDDETQAEELASATFAIAADDSDGANKKEKYAVILRGEGMGKTMPELYRYTLVIEPEDQPAATRESEILEIVGLMRSMLKEVMAEYLKLAAAAPKLVAANAETAQKLGEALAKTSEGSAEWEFRSRKMDFDLKLAVAELDRADRASARFYESFGDLWQSLTPYLDVVAETLSGGSKGTPSGPTPDEIRTVFHDADPELASLALAFLAAGTNEAPAIRIALIDRWQKTDPDTKSAVMQGIGKLPKDRVIVLAVWMKRNGFT